MGGGMGQRSLVAGANALFRWSESRRAVPRILEDPLAGLFAERDLRVAAIRYGRFLLPPLGRMIEELQTVHCVRHRSIDELVLRAVERDGYRQVVIIGAGYDMRVHRFAERLKGVRWIEVDSPVMAERKARLLSLAPGRSRSAELASRDLESGSLLDALASTSFNPAEPACMVAEGLVHYLSPARFDALLADVARGPGRRRLVFSFIRTDMYERAPGLFIRLVKMVREIPRLHFTPEALEAVCARHGLVGFETWRIEQQIEAFAPEARGRPAGVSQDVAQVERG